MLLLVRLHPPLLDRGPGQDDPPGHLLLLDRATRLLQHLDVFLHAGKHRQRFIEEFCFMFCNEVGFLREVLRLVEETSLKSLRLRDLLD